MRARLTLAYAQVACEVREVDLSNKPQAMIEVSANATTPVFCLASGEVIDDSLALMHWALQRHDPDSWWPDRKAMQLTMDNLVNGSDSEFAPLAYRYIYIDQHPQLSKEQLRGDAEIFLTMLDARLQHGSFLVGSSLSFADIAIFPFIYKFAEADPAWFAICPYINLRYWLHNIANRSWVKALTAPQMAWLPEDEPRYLSLMEMA
jgi:glutathione S-transferase